MDIGDCSLDAPHLKNPLIPPPTASDITRWKLKHFNETIVCFICSGYLIEATTATECLHSFCKSCIVKYISNNKNCPRCGIQINYGCLRADRTLKSIVYKLVPGLFKNEQRRMMQFHDDNEMKKLLENKKRTTDLTYARSESEDENHCKKRNSSDTCYFSPDDPISLSLDYYIESVSAKDSIGQIPAPRYLQCPAALLIRHLQRFIFSKFDVHHQQLKIDVIYEGEILPKDLSLMDVAYCFKWKRGAPMKFSYRIYNPNCDLNVTEEKVKPALLLNVFTNKKHSSKDSGSVGSPADSAIQAIKRPKITLPKAGGACLPNRSESTKYNQLSFPKTWANDANNMHFRKQLRMSRDFKDLRGNSIDAPKNRNNILPNSSQQIADTKRTVKFELLDNKTDNVVTAKLADVKKEKCESSTANSPLNKTKIEAPSCPPNKDKLNSASAGCSSNSNNANTPAPLSAKHTANSVASPMVQHVKDTQKPAVPIPVKKCYVNVRRFSNMQETKPQIPPTNTNNFSSTKLGVPETSRNVNSPRVPVANQKTELITPQKVTKRKSDDNFVEPQSKRAQSEAETAAVPAQQSSASNANTATKPRVKFADTVLEIGKNPSPFVQLSLSSHERRASHDLTEPCPKKRKMNGNILPDIDRKPILLQPAPKMIKEPFDRLKVSMSAAIVDEFKPTMPSPQSVRPRSMSTSAAVAAASASLAATTAANHLKRSTSLELTGTLTPTVERLKNADAATTKLRDRLMTDNKLKDVQVVSKTVETTPSASVASKSPPASVASTVSTSSGSSTATVASAASKTSTLSVASTVSATSAASVVTSTTSTVSTVSPASTVPIAHKVSAVSVSCMPTPINTSAQRPTKNDTANKVKPLVPKTVEKVPPPQQYQQQVQQQQRPNEQPPKSFLEMFNLKANNSQDHVHQSARSIRPLPPTLPLVKIKSKKIAEPVRKLQEILPKPSPPDAKLYRDRKPSQPQLIAPKPPTSTGALDLSKKPTPPPPRMPVTVAKTLLTAAAPEVAMPKTETAKVVGPAKPLPPLKLNDIGSFLKFNTLPTKVNASTSPPQPNPVESKSSPRSSNDLPSTSHAPTVKSTVASADMPASVAETPPVASRFLKIPKLNEISKIRSSQIRSQNPSIRNIPNPSALAFRNQSTKVDVSVAPVSTSTNISPPQLVLSKRDNCGVPKLPTLPLPPLQVATATSTQSATTPTPSIPSTLATPQSTRKLPSPLAAAQTAGSPSQQSQSQSQLTPTATISTPTPPQSSAATLSPSQPTTATSPHSQQPQQLQQSTTVQADKGDTKSGKIAIAKKHQHIELLAVTLRALAGDPTAQQLIT